MSSMNLTVTSSYSQKYSFSLAFLILIENHNNCEYNQNERIVLTSVNTNVSDLDLLRYWSHPTAANWSHWERCFFIWKDSHTDHLWTSHSSEAADVVYGPLIHWESQWLSGTADINLELHVALHLLLCVLTVLSLAAGWAQSGTETDLISLCLSPWQNWSRLSHHSWLVSSIATQRSF